MLLAAGLLLAACEGPSKSEKPAAAPPAPAGPARLLRLAPGVLDEIDLRRSEERAYLLDLAAGQYAGLRVEQEGIDVAVSLQGPDGRTVAGVDSNNGILGPEPLPVVAAAGGRYRLDIRASPDVPAGRCVLRLDALRPATARDHLRVEAERVLAASEQLRLRGDPASLRQAVAQEKDALTRFHALNAREREAETLFCLGRAHAGLGEGEASAGFYRQALALYRAVGDGPQTAVTLNNLGFWESFFDRPEAARALYREALPLHRRYRNQPEEALALSNLGRAAMDLGETGEALASFEQALALCRALGLRNLEGLTLSHLGQLEIDLGQPWRALAHLDRALALLTAAGDRKGTGVTLARIGVARALMDRPRDEVLAAFRRALEVQREIGDRREEAVTLHNLGWSRYRAGELHQARTIFRDMLAAFRARGDRSNEARALLNLGGIDLDLGPPGPAEASFTRARALLQEIGDPDHEALALLGLARALRKQGRRAEALAAIEGAFSRIEALRRKPSSLDLRLTFFAGKQDVYELRIALLMEADQAARALTASEEARARTLLDLLAAADVRAEGSGAALTAAEIQRRVAEPGTLLLEYSLGRERSFLWAVTPASIESFALPPRAELEDQARRAAALLAASGRALARSQTDLALAELSRLLLGPVAHRLRAGDRLVIIPDGALWSISFAALPDPTGNAPLVAGHEIVLLPSASVLPRLRQETRSPAPGRLAVVADPVFDADDSRVRRGARGPGAPARSPDRLARLPFSRAEAEAILALAPRAESFAALDFAASRETVLRGGLGRYRIVHFATHAVLDPVQPERSGIALSGVDPAGAPRNGFLRLQDIYRLRLPADLVVVSACQTALGREVQGEGLIGLTRGFFAAGARQVLVSLWPVDDRSTAELMERFYARMLTCGQPPAAALRAAQVSLWKEGGRRAPAEWAGFILQGDWRVLPDKPSAPLADLSFCEGRKPQEPDGGSQP